MAEYLERQVAMTMQVVPKRYRKFQTNNLDDAYEQGWVDALDNLKNLPAVDVEKISDGYHTFSDLYEQRLILSAALAKIIRMHGKASGMKMAAFLSGEVGLSWVLTQTKGVIHTIMS